MNEPMPICTSKKSASNHNVIPKLVSAYVKKTAERGLPTMSLLRKRPLASSLPVHTEIHTLCAKATTGSVIHKPSFMVAASFARAPSTMPESASSASVTIQNHFEWRIRNPSAQNNPLIVSRLS